MCQKNAGRKYFYLHNCIQFYTSYLLFHFCHTKGSSIQIALLISFLSISHFSVCFYWNPSAFVTDFIFLYFINDNRIVFIVVSHLSWQHFFLRKAISRVHHYIGFFRPLLIRYMEASHACSIRCISLIDRVLSFEIVAVLLFLIPYRTDIDAVNWDLWFPVSPSFQVCKLYFVHPGFVLLTLNLSLYIVLVPNSKGDVSWFISCHTVNFSRCFLLNRFDESRIESVLVYLV